MACSSFSYSEDTCSQFSLPVVRVHLFHDGVIEVLVGKEGGSDHHGEADGQDHPHEAAVNQGVHAVALNTQASSFYQISNSRLIACRILELHDR